MCQGSVLTKLFPHNIYILYILVVSVFLKTTIILPVPSAGCVEQGPIILNIFPFGFGKSENDGQGKIFSRVDGDGRARGEILNVRRSVRSVTNVNQSKKNDYRYSLFWYGRSSVHGRTEYFVLPTTNDLMRIPYATISLRSIPTS